MHSPIRRIVNRGQRRPEPSPVKPVSRLAKTGAIHTAHVVGYKRGWRVLLTYDMTERPLAARRGNERVFKSLKTIVSCLRDMGIVRFDVDAFAAKRVRSC
jgi:hypothetical protein